MAGTSHISPITPIAFIYQVPIYLSQQALGFAAGPPLHNHATTEKVLQQYLHHVKLAQQQCALQFRNSS